MPEHNLYKMTDSRLNVLGRKYRALCKREGATIGGVTVLMRGDRMITFEQFVADRNAARDIDTHNWRKGLKARPPEVSDFPI